MFAELLNNRTGEEAKDLIALLSALVDIPKRGRVRYGTTDFDYCLLDDIIKAIRENSDKFALLQPTTYENGLVTTTAILIHVSGSILESPPFSFPVPPPQPKRDRDGKPLPQSEADKIPRPQDVAAVTTYARRYALASFLGIAADPDVDGDDPTAEKVPIKRGNAEKARKDPPLPQKQEPPKAADPAQGEAPKAGRDFLAEARAYELNGRNLGTLSFKELVLSEIGAPKDALKRIIYLINNDPKIITERARIKDLFAPLKRAGYAYDKKTLLKVAKGKDELALKARTLLEASPDFADAP